jgi:hypothetical protein
LGGRDLKRDRCPNDPFGRCVGFGFGGRVRRLRGIERGFWGRGQWVVLGMGCWGFCRVLVGEVVLME